MEPKLRNCQSYNSFRITYKLHYQVPSENHFYMNNRRHEILRVKLRTNALPTNEWLFKRGLRDTKQCKCQYKTETALHYLLLCPRYSSQRTLMLAPTKPLFDSFLHFCKQTVPTLFFIQLGASICRY